jgi:hypothetical protein
MSEKALAMLTHMRRQILGQPAPYVAVRGAAISVGVDPPEANAMAWSMSCWVVDTSDDTPVPALPRTGSTASPTGA